MTLSNDQALWGVTCTGVMALRMSFSGFKRHHARLVGRHGLY